MKEKKEREEWKRAYQNQAGLNDSKKSNTKKKVKFDECTTWPNGFSDLTSFFWNWIMFNSSCF